MAFDQNVYVYWSGSNQGLQYQMFMCATSMTYVDVSTSVEFFPELLQVNFYHLQTVIEHNVHVLCIGYNFGSMYIIHTVVR